MKFLLLILNCLILFTVQAQQSQFPQSWTGNWKGELEWFKTGTNGSQKVKMELRIQPMDSTGQFSWQIIYGSASEDNRPYTLISKDSTGIHWVIDEHNGIVLDQYLVGNKFAGAFTVMGNTILNNYTLENDKMMVEFYSINAKPVTSSGLDTESSPVVDSYRIGSYQKAVLFRTK